jgi:hypothetical protein
MAGCGALSGLDSIQESVCAPNCDPEGGEDATFESDEDGAVGANADHEAPGATRDDSTAEASMEAGSEGWTTEGTADAPGETGCGALNVTANCSACGMMCAPAVSNVTSAQCVGRSDGTGATCQYTCTTGWLDCNATKSPPDTDGCECNAPSAQPSDCCNGGCPIAHDNGLNNATSTFYECSTSPAVIALDACAAFTGDVSQCSDAYQCDDAADGGVADYLVCSDGSLTDCICWDYAGLYAGRVHDSKKPFPSCDCASSTDPTYN